MRNVIIALGLLASSTTCHAQFQMPRMWAEQAVPANASLNGQIVSEVRVKTVSEISESCGLLEPNRYMSATGGEVADKTCDAILSRGLGTGQVAVHLEGFGAGLIHPVCDGSSGSAFFNSVPLTFHPMDGVSPAVAGRTQGTPWNVTGVMVAKDWMTAYCAQYEIRRLANPAIPIPSRFHVDFETYWDAGTDAVCFFINSIMTDPRWNDPTKLLKGRGTTMKAAYDAYLAAGNPAPTLVYNAAGDCWYNTELNGKWFEWYHGVLREEYSAAFKEAIQDVLPVAWTSAPGGCKTSVYELASVDGITNPALPPFNVSRTFHNYQPGDWDWRHAYTNHLPLHAPVLYVFSTPTYPNLFAQGMADARDYVDSVGHSFGGAQWGNIAPYITLGSTFPSSEIVTNDLAVFRPLMALLRSKQIDEAKVWHSVPTAKWIDFARSVHNAWSSNPISAGVGEGEHVSGNVDSIKYSKYDNWVVRSVQYPNGQWRTNVYAHFNTAYTQVSTTALSAYVESFADVPDGTLDILVQNKKTAPYYFYRVAKDLPINTQRSIHRVNFTGAFYDDAGVLHVNEINPCEFVGSDGVVTVSLLHKFPVLATAPVVSIDLIQMIREGHCPADFDRNGVNDVQDIFAFLNAWFASSPSAGFSCIGAVDVPDIFAFLNSWFAQNCDDPTAW